MNTRTGHAFIMYVKNLHFVLHVGAFFAGVLQVFCRYFLQLAGRQSSNPNPSAPFQPGQGATRATQRPLSRLPLSTHAPSTPHIAPSTHPGQGPWHSNGRHTIGARGGRVRFEGGTRDAPTPQRAPLFSAGENPCLKNPTYILAYIWKDWWPGEREGLVWVV